MDTLSEIDKLTRDTRRREYDDGLIDFLVGSIVLFFSLVSGFFYSLMGYWWFLKNLRLNKEITNIGLIVLFLLLLLLPLCMRRLIDRLRKTSSWTKHGYVKPLRLQAGWQIYVLPFAVILIIIITSVLLMRNGSIGQEFVLRSVVASTGIGTGIMYVKLGRELKIKRYFSVGLVGGILSALIFFVPTTFSISWLLFGMVWMSVLSISGSFALRKFLLVSKEQEGE